MAKWMPFKSRPGIGRSRGFSEPPDSTTASCSATSLSIGDIDADIGAVMEGHAFGFHLRDAAVDMDLFHLEVGNAVAQQAAGLGPALIDMHVVAGARELLRAGQTRRAGADDGDLLAGLGRRNVGLQALRDGAVGDLAFDGLDGDRIVVDVERAGRFARRRTDAAGEFREIVGRVQVARGFVPVAAIDQIVPVRNLVVDRAAGRRAGDAAGCRGNRARRNPCSARPGRALPFPASGRTNSCQCLIRSSTGAYLRS